MIGKLLLALSVTILIGCGGSPISSVITPSLEKENCENAIQEVINSVDSQFRNQVDCTQSVWPPKNSNYYLKQISLCAENTYEKYFYFNEQITIMYKNGVLIGATGKSLPSCSKQFFNNVPTLTCGTSKSLWCTPPA